VKTRSALVYSVLRLLAFLVPFGIMMLFPIFRELYWVAAIFAALIGLSLSMLFLRRPLAEATSGLAERRAQRLSGTTDEDVEDAAIADALPATATPGGSESTSADERPEQERTVRD